MTTANATPAPRTTPVIQFRTRGTCIGGHDCEVVITTTLTGIEQRCRHCSEKRTRPSGE